MKTPNRHIPCSPAIIIGGVLLIGPLCPSPSLASQEVDSRRGTVQFRATLQAGAFERSLPPDHRYHAIVHAEGGAAPNALFVTAVPDTTLARTLRAMGADDQGGIPLSAWRLRWVPFVSAPTARVTGTPVSVTVTWDGAPREYALTELLKDPGGRGVDIRFGGHEHHNEEWASGCILCLFSCPGGVLSNASYTIRDHQRGVTDFAASDLLPPDGTEVTITFTLEPG
ncbi:MAG: YdjY domain-containing protein [Gemmatimonadota bacterium]